MSDFIEKVLPHMLIGEDLEQALTCLPGYDPSICKADAATRLMELNHLSELYIPSSMTFEIYSKIYLSMLHSLSKKQTTNAIRQGNMNHKTMQKVNYTSNSILGGSDSFSIVGKSGIGKSTAILKSVELLGGREPIILHNPYQVILPVVNVQCPHDCSVKGLLLSILGEVDMLLGTDYRDKSIKSRSTIDVLIGMVSQVSLNHILLIVIDECQNILYNKNGINLVSCLTQLINSSGISMCLVGLPELEALFQQKMYFARRSIGLSYTETVYDDYFINFSKTVFSYQYVKKPSFINPEIIDVLYQCTNGVIGLVVSLIMESQQVAILSGKEELTKEVILNTFHTRMKNLQSFSVEEPVKVKQTSTLPKKKPTVSKAKYKEEVSIGTTLKQLVQQSKEENIDIVNLLMASDIQVMEIEI